MNNVFAHKVTWHPHDLQLWKSKPPNHHEHEHKDDEWKLKRNLNTMNTRKENKRKQNTQMKNIKRPLKPKLLIG